MRKSNSHSRMILLRYFFIFLLVGVSSASNFEEPFRCSRNISSIQKRSVHVRFFFNGDIGDLGWVYAAQQGRLYMQAQLSYEVETSHAIVFDNGDSAETYAVTVAAVHAAVKDGVSLIIGHSFGYSDGLYDMAGEYPNIYFVHISGFRTRPNLANAFGRIYEARYLSGLLVGSITKTNVACYIAAIPIPEVYRGINAFAAGVHKTNPNAIVYVYWTNSWSNSRLEAFAADKLFSTSCCDVITHHTDTLAIHKVARDYERFSIGYNSDMGIFIGSSVLTSVIWNWGPLFLYFARFVIDGTWNSRVERNLWSGMDSDFVRLSPLSFRVPSDIISLINNHSDVLREGEDEIFCGNFFNLSDPGSCLTDEEKLGVRITQLPPNVKDLGFVSIPCRNDCSFRGKCSVSGICSCETGWAGDTCDVNINHGRTTGIIVGSVMGVLVVIIVIIVAKLKSRLNSIKNDARANFIIIPYDEFEIREVLGEGSFGVVYYAIWHGTAVAIKQIRMHQDISRSSDDGGNLQNLLYRSRSANVDESKKRLAALEALHSELKLMASLRHPNVLLYMGMSEKPVSIVTEYAARGSVRSIYLDQNSFDWNLRISILYDTAKGIRYLHAHVPTIYHRDLKCLNLLVDQSYVCKVADFGLSSTHRNHQISGTLLWCAPELYYAEFSVQCDIFSFGMVMVEVLNREIPYQKCVLGGVSVQKIYMDKICRNVHPPLINMTFTSYVQLVGRCLSLEPSKRPSLAEISAILENMKDSNFVTELNENKGEIIHVVDASLDDTDTMKDAIKTALHTKLSIDQSKVEKVDQELVEDEFLEHE